MNIIVSRSADSTDAYDLEFPDTEDRIKGIRPEHLDPCAEAEAMLVLDADLIEPLGADTLVYGQTSGTRIAARLHSSMDARAGKLYLRYRPQHAHYFDAQTGARL